MNAINATASYTTHREPAASALPAAAPPASVNSAPAATVTLSASAQRALAPQPDAGNIPWGSGPNR